MPKEGNNIERLLSSDEPSPFQTLNGSAVKPLLLLCDHASRYIPAALDGLGVDPAVRRCHLASDIGAGSLTELLAQRLAATAVLQSYSRMVIDCNRELLDPGAFLEFGDGVVVAGNRNLSAVDKQMRADEIYWPYHRQISAQISRFAERDIRPAIIAIHSFTPVMNGLARPWEVGILWDTDGRIAQPMIAAFRAMDFVVGDNEPYSGKAPQDFTIDHHAEANELPHVGIEIRQDLIANNEGVTAIADVLGPIIERILLQLFPTNIQRHRKKAPAT